jgi:pectate lyase
MEHNTTIMARFLSEGTTMDPDLTGYATVQDDRGTPFLVTGGMTGDTMAAGTLEQLQELLADTLPHVVTMDRKITGTGNLKIYSDKTLICVGDSAHIQGMELDISGVRNVIVRNLKISHAEGRDAIGISGGSRNIWIDHCDFFSDRDHDKDYYDGLLDITNGSSFITVSWCRLHDHYKTSLISSGDQAVADTVIRITYHHNYFYNCESRLPSIRFGRAHIFNNYFKDCGTAINLRMEACVRVERNYFNNVNRAVMMEYSPVPGSVELIDNYFGSSIYAESPACQLAVPYDYSGFLSETADLPFLITGDITSLESYTELPQNFTLDNYPNPFNPVTNIEYRIPNIQFVTLKIYNILGQEVATLVSQKQEPGLHVIQWDASEYVSGVYVYQLLTTNRILTKKMLLLQ